MKNAKSEHPVGEVRVWWVHENGDGKGLSG